jgi:hypothetical protein
MLHRPVAAYLVVLEVLVHLQALVLLHASKDAHTGEVALVQQRVEGLGALHALHKDDHLQHRGQSFTEEGVSK